MPVETSYVGELRRRINDVRHSRRAFTITVTDDQVTRCIAEVTNGRLIITPQGGSAAKIDLKLTSSSYDTIGALHQVISRSQGYAAQLDEDANVDHVSVDLEPFGPIDIRGTGIELRHRLFGDGELGDLITRALQRHNPSMTLSTMPPQEWTFVLSLAHAEVCRVQAYDASKRKGLDTDTETLLRLAESFETQYEKDRERNARAIQSPREANSNLVDEGDVMLGQMNRLSLRTGFMSPLAKAIPPDAAVLNELDERDIEDDNVRLVWQRNKNVDFYEYELWMDSSPEVIRTREGGQIYAGRQIAYTTTEDTRRDGAVRQTSSIMVFRSFGANAPSQRSSFSTFVETFGQGFKSFAVGKLESETTYYFRLYIVSTNYQAVGSNIIKATTKKLRTRFGNPVYRDKDSGTAGDVVTITFDSTKGAFTAQHTFKIGEKIVTPTIIDAFHISFTVPTFENKGLKDFVVISPNRLIDVRSNAFTVR